MKKFLAMITSAILIGVCVFALSDNPASAYIKVPLGTYQCAVCGIIVRIGNGSVLDETSFYDGHTHDWRYIGGLSGTIHPVK